MKWNVGDIVARPSYRCDVLFRIIEIKNDIVELCGEDIRLIADAPIDDIVLVDEVEQEERRKKDKQREESCYYLFRQDYRLLKQRGEYEVTNGYSSKQSYFELRGRVLHIDGDQVYLNKCIALYEKLGVPVYGVHVEEREMPAQIESLIEMVRPDILVITGHDAYSKSKGSRKDMKAYRNSKYFTETVRIARRKVPQLDQLVIFAGACQSHFENIIKAGANFASSPERINIHALDPVYIVARVSLTSFMEQVSIWDIIRNTITGEKGLGGIETRGLLRKGMPYHVAEE